VALYSVGSEFLSVDQYRGALSENERFRVLRQWMSCRRRGDVEAVVFDCLGRPVFFDQAVDLVMERLVARIEAQGSANSQNPSCACATGNGRARREPRPEHALVLPSYVGRCGGRATVDSGHGSGAGSETSRHS
jgi:hypothetical protein